MMRAISITALFPLYVSIHICRCKILNSSNRVVRLAPRVITDFPYCWHRVCFLAPRPVVNPCDCWHSVFRPELSTGSDTDLHNSRLDLPLHPRCRPPVESLFSEIPTRKSIGTVSKIFHVGRVGCRPNSRSGPTDCQL